MMAGAACSLTGLSAAAEPIVIARNGTPWLLAETIPLTSFGRDIFAAGHSLLYLTDLAAERTPSEILLRTAFELTPAEARLAACLAGGGGIGPAAQRLGIGRETIRTQLRAIFDKTGVRSQAHLTALLSQIRNRSGH
jgi:DNA-binding CsgD family transcriptional regulator